MAVDCIEKALVNILQNDAAVANVVAARIYPETMPQGASLPVIIYHIISGAWDITMDGEMNLARSRFQFDQWAAEYKQARELSDAVRAALDGYSGTVGTVEIEAIRLLDEDDLFADLPDVEGLRRSGKRLDFEIWYKYIS